MRDALRRGMGAVRYPEVRANYAGRLAKGEFHEVPRTKHASSPRITSAQAIAAEREVIRAVNGSKRFIEPILPIQQAMAITHTHPVLNTSQRRAIEAVLTSRDQIQGIQGYAGTGKTTALNTIRQAAEQQGYAVRGLAPTLKAAAQLSEVGISAGTLQRHLAKNEHIPQDPTGKRLYFLDESSLASTIQMRDFLSRLRPLDRVVLVGDVRQHEAVDAGRPFAQLQEAGMSTAKLDQIVRQKDPELKAAVEHLSRGEVVSAVRMLSEQGRVTEIANRSERFAAIARSYIADPQNTIIVSPDNASRRDINQVVRAELQKEGKVSHHEHAFLVPRQDMTGADRKWAVQYQIGDVLRYREGSKPLGIAASDYATVKAIDSQRNMLTVERADGALVGYDPRRLRGISAYQEAQHRFAEGDRVQFTAPLSDQKVANRDLATIERISENGMFTVRTEKGRLVEVDPARMPHFDHGYAVTSHSSQGLTTERVLINIDGNTHPDLINSRFA